VVPQALEKDPSTQGRELEGLEIDVDLISMPRIRPKKSRYDGGKYAVEVEEEYDGANPL